MRCDQNRNSNDRPMRRYKERGQVHMQVCNTTTQLVCKKLWSHSAKHLTHWHMARRAVPHSARHYTTLLSKTAVQQYVAAILTRLYRLCFTNTDG